MRKTAWISLYIVDKYIRVSGDLESNRHSTQLETHLRYCNSQEEIALIRLVYCHQLFIHTIILSPCVRYVSLSLSLFQIFFSPLCCCQWSLIGFEWSAIACCCQVNEAKPNKCFWPGQLCAPGCEPNCSRFVASISAKRRQGSMGKGRRGGCLHFTTPQ